MSKPDVQLTDYERQLKYGEGGDPRRLNPHIDKAFETVEEGDKWDVNKVFQQAIRIARGHANPKSLHDLVKERIKLRMKETACQSLNGYIEEVGGVLGVSEAQGWHYARSNMISVLFDMSKGSVPLDDIAQVADEVIADCVQANTVREERPRRDDEQTE
jgi:hypothetical protein